MQKKRFWQHFSQAGHNARQCKAIKRLLDAGPGGFEGGMTNRKYAGLTHISRATAQRELADLVARGSLKNIFTFWTPIHPVRRRCESSEDARYSCASAPCRSGASTSKIVNLFFREP